MSSGMLAIATACARFSLVSFGSSALDGARGTPDQGALILRSSV
jgi:hypothetical protein